MEISRGKGRGYVWREILIGNCLRDGVRDLIWTSSFGAGTDLVFEEPSMFYKFLKREILILLFFKLVEFSNVLYLRIIIRRA